MIQLDDIRRIATALPEVEEVTHFRLPSFKVSGKPFAGMEKGDATAVFSVSQQEAATAVAADPGTYAEVWRTASTKIWVGLRVDLAKVSQERIQELVEHAWRNKAPKRVVAAYDALARPNDDQ
ncbi:MmcQ/YjbR family DNA-binding protein [Nonomuraea sp. CA-141351]|uniref:MmcQ/YjbR family DNA-binding protein n=1 Tax=Nonomuraea sp. CA-141351 TaxID=3239996 RepID=UPI003D8AFA2E